MTDQTTIEQLLRDPRAILDLAATDPRRAEAFWHGLSRAERLRAILACDAADRERLIILAQDSGPLVRALAPDEFVNTVLELGPESAIEFVAASTDEQLTFLLDLTGWNGERLSPQRYESWLPVIMEAGAGRLARWLEITDIEVLALLFAHWFRVVKFLISQDEQEPPDDLPGFSLDGVYFIDFRDEDSRGWVAQTLVVLQNNWPERYAQVLEAMLWESAIGMAEDAYQWRAGRLAEMGMPTRQEALELWAVPPPAEADWRAMPTKDELAFLRDAPPRSDGALNLLPKEQALPQVAGRLDGHAADRLRAELVYAANCGVMALDADPADPEAVARAGRESLGLVNLGLDLLAQGDRETAGQIVARLGVAAMARQGAQAIRQLNLRAWRLANDGWLAKAPGGLHILDEPLDRWLAGLLFPRPRCYDPTMGDGREYRAFVSLADLEQARRYLDLAEFWGELLELMDITPETMATLAAALSHEPGADHLKLRAVVGTWLACEALDLRPPRAIPEALLPKAVAALQKGLDGGLQRRLLDSVAALGDNVRAEMAGQLLRQTLAAITGDLAAVNAATADRRFIASLVVEP